MAVILACAPAVHAAPGPAVALAQVPADWRRDVNSEREQNALRAQGWRLEDNGSAISPETKKPVSRGELIKAVTDLRNGARRAALERVNLMLESGQPLSFEDQEVVDALTPDLPPGLAKALKDPKSSPASLRAMADSDLAKIAAYFDGSRSLADRQAAAAPVRAVEGGKRANLPYLSADEQQLGDSLRSAAVKAISTDPFGRTVLARLNGADGRPDLPPILVGELGRAVAVYDARRQAVVVDREILLTSVVEDAPPAQRTALRQKLSANGVLMAHLLANPSTVEAFARKNDVVMVHELTHAWQDRREPVLREIARGNLPDVQLLEYEEEAYITKNLYIHSKLKHDPASVLEDDEFRDYLLMAHGARSWREQLLETLERTSPAYAINIVSVGKILRARTDSTALRTVSTQDEQRNKALELSALHKGNSALTSLSTSMPARLTPLYADADKATVERLSRLANYYLRKAQSAANPVERTVKLEHAERYAKASGDKKLIEAVNREKGKR